VLLAEIEQCGLICRAERLRRGSARQRAVFDEVSQTLPFDPTTTREQAPPRN
jgi:hypothetical protein